MKESTNGMAVERKPLRLWPGVVIVVIQWLARFVVPAFVPEALQVGVFAGLLGGVAILLWWLFFSRASWPERGAAVALIIGAVLATPLILHKSIATGNMGFMFPIFVIPVLSLAFVLWAVVTRSMPNKTRWVTMVAAIVIACGVWALFRTGGNTTDFDHDFAWRWTPTDEEQLLAEMGTDSGPSSLSAQASSLSTEVTGTPAWPGFRGPNRDSIIRGEQIETDWATSPPVELWRQLIGPGWSSFAVWGDFIYTQEQRGEQELVSCYHGASGEPVWQHQDPARFWESVGGAGPRGTPTLRDGRIYTLGATGILNALDARDGSLIWSRNGAKDTGEELPDWGFSASPLVTDDLVMIAISGALSAYDRSTGEPRWTGPAAGVSYSSPHLLTIGGVEQVLQLNGDGLVAVTPTDGTVLWQHPWEGYPIVQPALAANGDVLISVNANSGTRRLAVNRDTDSWSVEERWTSSGLKSYFNDFVVHEGHAYGFDGNILACIQVEDGERQWKGGRYGGGQLVLVADQDVLVVLSEKGELALVEAKPEGFKELGKIPAIEGKTWNHPVLVDGVLFVRNSREMAAFRLSSAR